MFSKNWKKDVSIESEKAIYYKAMPNIFSMVTLKESNTYTIEALKSFFKYTELNDGDDFYLIDNDNFNIIIINFVKN